MKRNYSGCAICDSTWGDVWAEIDGERMFFCCELCVVQFRSLVDRLKSETGGSRLDSLEIHGDRKGRTCTAASGERVVRARFSFTPEGDLMRFERVEG